jgi:putative sterol carrier protein
MDTDMKRYDLMHQINGRGTFLVTKICSQYLTKGRNPHILNLSPPLSLQPRWFQNHVAYTMAKYNMSMCALGWAEEFRPDGIAANCLWPATAIYTAAMEMLGGGKGIKSQCRVPEIMADAAYVILGRDSKKATGYFYIDEAVLKEEGITDFKPYNCDPSTEPMPDFFIEGTESIHSSQYVIAMKGGATAAPPPPSPAAAAPSAAAAAGDGGEIMAIFTKIKGLVDPATVKNTNAIFQFDVKGDDGGMFYMDLKNGEGAVGKGDSPVKSDVTIAVSKADFLKLFSGKMSPTSAYMMGKLKIKGDITKAMVLDKLMGQLKSKL